MTAEWARCRLGQVVEERKRKILPEKGDGQPYVALEHLEQGSPRLLGWSSAGNATSAKTIFAKGDVLFGKLRPNLKKAVRAPFAGVCSTDILVLHGLEGRMTNEFLAHLCHWSPLQQHAIQTASGTKMPRTSWKLLAPFEFEVPPLPEQRKIAAILSSVDEAIEKTQAVIDQVQVVKKGLMQELLTRGLPGRHTRFKQTPIGEIPEEWAARPLGSVSNIVRGSSPRPARDPRYFNGDYIAWITVGEITKDEWPYLTETTTFLTEAGSERSRRLQSGTVLLTNSGATLGVPAISQIEACANDGIAAFLSLSQGIDKLFLYYTLQYRTSHLRDRVARGVGQPNLNTALIGDMMVAWPPLKEQKQVGAILLRLDSRIRAERNSQKALRELKRSLMAVLLTGEIRVSLEGADAL